MGDRKRAPFRVYKGGEGWFLQQCYPDVRTGFATFPVYYGFATAGEAIDHAYRMWPAR